jgi:hypothetical protein
MLIEYENTAMPHTQTKYRKKMRKSHTTRGRQRLKY